MSKNTQSTFKPAWWLRSSHLQTIWPTFCRSLAKVKMQRERLELPDGDFVDLDWIGEPGQPTVILLHGLEGSIESPYAHGMLIALQKQGWRSVLMHFRSCSGELNRHARAYHSGDTYDIAFVIKSLQDREPHVPMAAVGFSLGGNVLLKWLGETASRNPLRAAVGVSVPFVLQNAAHRVQQGFSRVYQWHFLKSLRKKIQTKVEAQKIKFRIPPLEEMHTLYEFDDKVTAPLHGFLNADDYYIRSSCRQYLKQIATPTLILNAKDDPFMTQEAIPRAEEVSNKVVLEITEKGGHVGFVSGKTPWHPEYWLESRIPDFLRDYLV